MRLASNKLYDVIGFYRSELSTLYGESETDALLQLSLAHFLGFSRADLITRSNKNINQSDLIKLYDCCKDLKKNIPFQYIINEAWFYKLKFRVNPHVLIPRPETEELVDLILRENKMPASYLDIGTGSGCIPIAIKKNSLQSEVSACDISTAALKIAAENARLNQAEINFFEGDVCSDSFEKDLKGTFDVIVSNPPYIKYSEKKSLEKHVLEQEPHLALFVEGNDPIIFYKKIIAICKNKLRQNGILYFELNPLTAADVKTCAIESGHFNEVTLLNDMSANVRFLKACKN